MRFVDEVKIYVRAGNGGNGCVSFRREAHVPRGGPNGGDGGNGGDIVFVADHNLTTLLDLRYQRHYRAKNGIPGRGADRHGKNGEPLEIRVPCGTLVYDADSGDLIGDLVEHDGSIIAARGGRGGRGNARFATPTDRAPRKFEEGTTGEEFNLRLELKLLAEVGLVGLPSSGKSTLISKVSAARPKIADYPFTTLVPNLGMVSLAGDRSFVMADIPGLIEGASQGAGLGHRFLRHIERTRVLLYLLDDRHLLVGEEGDPLDDLQVLEGELAAHDPELANKAALVALNKCDLLDDERRAALEARFAESGREIRWLSAVTGEGLPTLMEALHALLVEQRRAAESDPPLEGAAEPLPGHDLDGVA